MSYPEITPGSQGSFYFDEEGNFVGMSTNLIAIKDIHDRPVLANRYCGPGITPGPHRLHVQISTAEGNINLSREEALRLADAIQEGLS